MATVAPYACMIMCRNFGKNLTTFAEVTIKTRMDPSSRTRAWLTTVLYLRRLWFIYIIYILINYLYINI